MVHHAARADVCMMAPAVINASVDQCFWKQMHNWYTDGVRYVEWIDFQAPLLRRDIVEIIREYDEILLYGWGQDIEAGMVADDHGLKVGVADNICITHLNSQTLRKGVVDLEGNPLSSEEYCRRAEHGMFEFMKKTGRLEKFTNFRNRAANYVCES